jgi:HK97 family phage prohead protease
MPTTAVKTTTATVPAPPGIARQRPFTRRNVETSLQLRADGDLPPGVCGRLSVIALNFDVTDSYGTSFAPGCAARSIGQKVAARKIPFLMDHNREVRAHVGVVASMDEVGASYHSVIDLFDTDDGRRALEYAKAVLAANASTGVSVGFVPRRSELVKVGERSIERFTEIELRELSLTPMPAVPGADVVGARHGEGAGDEVADEGLDEERDDVTLLSSAARAALDALPVEARTALIQQYADLLPAAPSAGSSASSTDATTAATAPDTAARMATMDERITALRSTYAVPE